MCRREADLFKVLGVESRIRIIDLLKNRGPMYVNEMAEILGITASAVSQHLKILRHAGLVRNERRGFWIAYEVDQAALEHCGEVISTVCRCGCEGSCHTADHHVGVETNPEDEDLAYLKRLEQELEEKLQEVRTRIKEATPDA